MPFGQKDAISGALVAERAKVGDATFFRHHADISALLVDTVATVTGDPAWSCVRRVARREERRC